MGVTVNCCFTRKLGGIGGVLGKWARSFFEWLFSSIFFLIILFNVPCFLLGDVVVHQYHIVLEIRVLGFMTLGLWWGLGISAGLTGDCCFTFKLLFLLLWVEFLLLLFGCSSHFP